MAPKKATSTRSSAATVGPLISSTNFFVGARVITKDLNSKPYARKVIGWLTACNVLDLCTFSQTQYSLSVVDEFHRQCTISSGKIKGTIRGCQVLIDEKVISQAFGLIHNPAKPIFLNNTELTEAWAILRPDEPMTGSGHLRKAFSPEVYLLSDIVDKIFCCKTGNKDRFTDEQLRITAAIVVRKEMNWAGLLLSQLCQSVLAVTEAHSPKRKFVRIINCLLMESCPTMVFQPHELISHTSSKEINATTLKFLEKVVHIPSGNEEEEASEEPEATQPAATASQSSPKAVDKVKGKGKAPVVQRPPRLYFDSKKMTPATVAALTPDEARAFATQMTEEAKEIKASNLKKRAARAAKNAAREATEEAEIANEAAKKPSAEAGQTLPATTTPAEEHPAVAVAKGKGRRAANPPASPPPLKRLRRGHQTETQTSPPTQAQTPTQTHTQTSSPNQPIPQDFPSAYQIMSAEDASAILPKEYDTIFHDTPATWIQVNPSALPDVIFPIAHLPPFLYNLIAFHHEGRGSVWYRTNYFHSNGNPIKWFRRSHMSKAAILRMFGKYLPTMSHTWNEVYC